jgi:putative tryptophan/tyrosine transport system substrate-binding protein
MKRRESLRTLAGGLLGAVFHVQAQQQQPPPRMARIGFVNDVLLGPLPASVLDAFKQALRERGWVEGRNLALVFRYAETPEQRPQIGAELAGLHLDVIVATSAAAFAFGDIQPGLAAGQKHWSPIRTTPIVFVAVSDPVGAGMVRSLARPGGNMTGLSYQGVELNPKRLELLKEAMPQLSRVAVLAYPTHPLRKKMVDEVEAVADRLGLQLVVHDVDTGGPELLDSAFDAMAQEKAQAVLGLQGPHFFRERARIANLALQHGLPSMFEGVEYADAGALMAYSASSDEIYRRAAGYVDRILKGARPADLPVEQPTQFELVINLKTAKALGITMPQTVLVRANRLIP